MVDRYTAEARHSLSENACLVVRAILQAPLPLLARGSAPQAFSGIQANRYARGNAASLPVLAGMITCLLSGACALDALSA